MNTCCLNCGTRGAEGAAFCGACGCLLFARIAAAAAADASPLAAHAVGRQALAGDEPVSAGSVPPVGAQAVVTQAVAAGAPAVAADTPPGAVSKGPSGKLVVMGLVALALVVWVFSKLGGGSSGSAGPPTTFAGSSTAPARPPAAVDNRPSPQMATPGAGQTSANDVPRPPVVNVGDSFTYETLDQVEPKLNNVTTRTVVASGSAGYDMSFVNEKSKYTRQLAYDGSLNLVSSRFGTGDGVNYSPPLQYFRFPLKPGDGWRSDSVETNIKTGKTRRHTLRASVGSFEQVTVPAGTFSAIRITIDSEVDDGGQISTGRDVSWYAPEARRTVLSELESRDPTGKIGRRRVQLLAYRLN